MRWIRLVTLGAAVVFIWPVLGGSAYAEDPDLQLYVDFETNDPESPDNNWWTTHDRSHNGFLVRLSSVNDTVALAPSGSGHALKATRRSIGSVHTRGEAVYERGDGLSVLTWARVDGDGWFRPFCLENGVGGGYLISAYMSSGQGGAWLGWTAPSDGPIFSVGVHAVATGEWFHYAAVYDAEWDNAFVYLNGEEAGRGEAAGEAGGGLG